MTTTLERTAGSREPERLRDGVLVVSGYGLRVAVEAGHLAVEDGIADKRRVARFSRLDRALKRVVIIGHAGTISLDAIRWLHGVGVPLIHLDTDGTVFSVSAPHGAIVPALRRAQAIAPDTGYAIRISIELVKAKLMAQKAVLARFPETDSYRATLDRLIADVEETTTLKQVRGLEANGARAYWVAWRELPVRWKAKDAKRRPKHWRAFGTRVSPLTGSSSPRKAVNPANALLNYLYAMLEAEAKIAALAVGLDPALGFLHTDSRNRDSLACDLMEPVRAVVDQWVLGFLERHEFVKEEVFELKDGQCRLLPPLTKQLAETSALWARKVLPVAQGVARALLQDDPMAVGKSLRGPSSRARRERRVVIREFAPRVDPREDPRRTAEAGAKRRKAMAKVVEENRIWESQNEPADPEVFRREIAPGLNAFKLAELMAVTGLGKGSCSKIRSGKVVPHPRHWDALGELLTLVPSGRC